MSGVVKVAAMVGATAGEGDGAIASPLASCKILVGVFAERGRVSWGVGDGCIHGAVILMFPRVSLMTSTA
jgi:hypothetical protein